MEQRGLEEKDGETKSLEGAAVKLPDMDSAPADRLVRFYLSQLWSKPPKKEDHVFQCARGAVYVRVIQSIENIPSALVWADESQSLM